MDEIIGSMRERLAAVEMEVRHLDERGRTTTAWTTGINGTIGRLDGSIGRLSGRLTEAERSLGDLRGSSEQARRAMAWIEAREAADRQRQSAKAESRQARKDAIALVYAVALLASVLLYLTGIIDGEKFRSIQQAGSALGLGR